MMLCIPGPGPPPPPPALKIQDLPQALVSSGPHKTRFGVLGFWDFGVFWGFEVLGLGVSGFWGLGVWGFRALGRTTCHDDVFYKFGYRALATHGSAV